MNVLFLTLLDFETIEERSIYTDLIREFIKNNHKMYIISPSEKRKNRPTTIKKEDEYSLLKLQIGNIQKTNIVEKGISTLTIETVFKKAISKYFNDVKFDLVLYSTPPITLQKTVEFVKRRDNATTYLLLKDIFPQNAVDLDMLQNKGIKKYILNYFRRKEKELYKISDYIGCMSQANVDFLIANNPIVSNKVVEICPNSIEPIDVLVKNKHEIRNKYNIPNDKTTFVYGGNLGKPQGIDFLIECISENEKNQNAFFLIVGTGTEYNKLYQFFCENRPNNSLLIEFLPKEEYETLVNACDVGLIFLDNRFTIPNFPSRILSYMQASMPVLAATDSNTDIGVIIQNAEFGYWCESGNGLSFSNYIIQLCNQDIRDVMGSNARKFLEENYTVKHSYEIINKHMNYKRKEV